MTSYDYWDIETGEGLSDYVLHQRYDDMLDEVLDEVWLGSLGPYMPSRVMKDIDPIAYRCGFCDWIDSELGETITDEQLEEVSA